HRRRRNGVPQSARREGAGRPPHAGGNEPAHPRLTPMPAPSFASIRVGDAPEPLRCGPLTRTDFVRYAGASLDLNPNHHDEVYAQANGNRTVFGMGMLAGGYCGRLLTGWLGQSALCRLRIRFASRFWPDDVLTISARVIGTREADG